MPSTRLAIDLVLDEAEANALESLRLKRRLPSQAETIAELVRCGLREEAWGHLTSSVRDSRLA